jgi:hypothetical protein
VSSDVLNILWQGFTQRGAWEEVPLTIKWNEPKMIKLDSSIEHIEH